LIFARPYDFYFTLPFYSVLSEMDQRGKLFPEA